MGKEKELNDYLPLSEATCYIMLALAKPMHGYGVMQFLEEVSGGTVRIGPGTLYGAVSTLENDKLIEMVREEGRRKVYRLTRKGEAVLNAQIERLEKMVRLGKRVFQDK